MTSILKHPCHSDCIYPTYTCSLLFPFKDSLHLLHMFILSCLLLKLQRYYISLSCEQFFVWFKYREQHVWKSVSSIALALAAAGSFSMQDRRSQMLVFVFYTLHEAVHTFTSMYLTEGWASTECLLLWSTLSSRHLSNSLLKYVSSCQGVTFDQKVGYHQGSALIKILGVLSQCMNPVPPCGKNNTINVLQWFRLKKLYTPSTHLIGWGAMQLYKYWRLC